MMVLVVLNQLMKHYFLPFIDHYIVWGTAQKKYYFNNKNFFSSKKISNVGCMRFDAIKNIKPQNVLKKIYLCDLISHLSHLGITL